ncbi:CLUMA_CG021517, isoform A [Clunio marinus]|uniref:CLUMA_CG021517, isoform A n=1 Tax=Clunio marinus TaxID=568069 RepID=A0A1J1JBU4_9DIPT|nr:CLUMA_CG021517, isoform A [Clunio marinus]
MKAEASFCFHDHNKYVNFKAISKFSVTSPQHQATLQFHHEYQIILRSKISGIRVELRSPINIHLCNIYVISSN